MEAVGEKGAGRVFFFPPLHFFFFFSDNPNTLTLERSLWAQSWATLGIEHKKLQQWGGIKLLKASTTVMSVMEVFPLITFPFLSLQVFFFLSMDSDWFLLYT